MRLMYDSVTASHIPLSARMVAGYDSGPYKWTTADWARFPNAVKVHIATQANVNSGQVLDVEPGDATPNQAPSWVHMRRVAGVDPSVYCNMASWPAVRQAFRDQQVPEPYYWIAKWDGKQEPIPGAIAKQYIDAPASGGHYDLSIVADFWPGIDGGKTMALRDDEDFDAVRWRIHALLNNVDRTQGPIAPETNKLAAVLNRLESKVDTLATQVDVLIKNGVSLKATGEIVVKAE